jgi:mannose-6-phosphate isomerase-like protein (cupin superfamily)
MASIAKVNLEAQLGRFQDYYNPRVVADLNGQQVKLVKLDSEFVWHHHDDEDEMFLVLGGLLRMEFRDQTVDLGPGEFIVVPRGVEHRPSAPAGETAVMLFEPATTLNTGNVRNERTREVLERL